MRMFEAHSTESHMMSTEVVSSEFDTTPGLPLTPEAKEHPAVGEELPSSDLWVLNILLAIPLWLGIVE